MLCLIIDLGETKRDCPNCLGKDRAAGWGLAQLELLARSCTSTENRDTWL